MDKNWLDREITFEDLDIPPEFESECAGDLMNELDNGLPYMENLDPDAEYIKAVAAGEYRHEMPKGLSSKEYGSGLMENVIINVPDEKALLAGFANIMGVGPYRPHGRRLSEGSCPEQDRQSRRHKRPDRNKEF